MDTIESTGIELTDEQFEQMAGGFNHDAHQHQLLQQKHEDQQRQHHHGHWIWWHHRQIWYLDN